MSAMPGDRAIVRDAGKSARGAGVILAEGRRRGMHSASSAGESIMRPIIAIMAAAIVAVAFASTEASARQGFRGGGFHGGFHGGFGGFRGPAFRGGVGFRGGPVFHSRFVHRPRFRHFAPGFAFGAPFAYGLFPSYYAYDDPCIVPRRVWTPYGGQIEWINVCY
jgi:hypothetical protein